MQIFLRLVWIIVRWGLDGESFRGSLKSTQNISSVDKIVEDIEKEYLSMSSLILERSIEKEKLNKRLKDLQHRLDRTKNVKNPNKRNINNKIASTRKIIREEIEDVKNRLEILEEEKG